MTNRPLTRWPLLLAAILGGATLAIAEPTTGPTLVDVTDPTAITANLNKDVTIEGVVEKAAWSASGKVMIINFKGVDSSKFGAVAFAKLKPRLDNAFGGDAAKHFTGAKLRIRGKITKYGGKVESLKDSLQLIVDDPSMVTIVEPAADATTKPS